MECGLKLRKGLPSRLLSETQSFSILKLEVLRVIRTSSPTSRGVLMVIKWTTYEGKEDPDRKEMRAEAM